MSRPRKPLACWYCSRYPGPGKERATHLVKDALIGGLQVRACRIHARINATYTGSRVYRFRRLT